MGKHWMIIEDNGGSLVVLQFDGDAAIFAAISDATESLANGVLDLMAGGGMSEWDGLEEDPQTVWDGYTIASRKIGGWNVIHDEDGWISRDEMGAAGQDLFNLCCRVAVAA